MNIIEDYLDNKAKEIINAEIKGIINDGNFCYAISIFQLISHINDFTVTCIETWDPNNKFSTLFVKLLCQIAKFQLKDEDVINISDMCVFEDGEMKGETVTTQQDCNEYIINLFEFLMQQKLHEKAIKENFYFKIEVLTTRINNTQNKFPQEEFLIMVQAYHITSINDGLKDYFERKSLVTEEGAIFKEMKCLTLPNYLIICINRTGFDINTNKSFKYQNGIYFPKYLSMKNYSYDENCNYELFGIVCHFGNLLRSGHYITILKKYNIFVKFNDANIEFCTEEYVFNQTDSVVLLVYEKINHIKKEIPYGPPGVNPDKILKFFHMEEEE